MPKILTTIYTDGFPNQFRGGPNNIIYKLIKHYKKEDYILNYLSRDLFLEELNTGKLENLEDNLSIKNKTTKYLFENSKIYRRIFTSDLYLPIHLLKKNIYFKSFQKKIKKYDIIHSQDSISLPLLTDNKVVPKKIVTVHSNGPLSLEITNKIKNSRLKSTIKKRLQKIERSAIQNADVVTFPSIAAKEIFFNDLNFQIDDEKLRIIYNGINPEEIIEIKPDKSILEKYKINSNYDLLILNISTFREERQLDKLFYSVKHLAAIFKKKILLLNIGSGPECESLAHLVRQIGVEKHVKLLGSIPNVDVIKLLKISDIFLMTTKRVIFDISLLEALACGTCCVVSNDGGNKEIIKDGVNGFLIDTNDVEGIAKKIISILPYKDNVKENAIKTAQQFSVERMVNEYFELYESLLK